MTTKIKPFFIKAITPLHVGSGSDLGVVDLPIQRESHTGFPKIEASSLKGAIRSEIYNEKLKAKNEKHRDKSNDEIKKEVEEEVVEIFGDGNKAGDLGFSDARVLFFPIKSVKGVFAYISCPMVLQRLKEDLELEKGKRLNLKIPVSIDDERCMVFKENENRINNKKNIVLEEYAFQVSNSILDDSLLTIPQIDKNKLVLISDSNFAHFVKNSTEVITRIRLVNGVADKASGGLFTEEYLPTETVMYALALGDTTGVKKIEMLQVGGNSTLGKGIVELIGLKDA